MATAWSLLASIIKHKICLFQNMKRRTPLLQGGKLSTYKKPGRYQKAKNQGADIQVWAVVSLSSVMKNDLVTN